MAIAEFLQLEEQVEQLLTQLERSRYENRHLQSKLLHISKENNQLREKQRKAATHVNKIITQLKEEAA